MTELNSTIDLFPLSIAFNDAFCNRTEELSKLTMYIEYHRPVLLVSPRRYGKTSLALRAIEASKLPYAHIDLFSAVDENDIERAVLKGVGSLISKIEGSSGISGFDLNRCKPPCLAEQSISVAV